MHNSFKLPLMSLFFIASGIAGYSVNAVAANNLIFKGTLVQKACSVATGDENVEVDFESINDKDLYINQRTSGLPFSIKLSECKLSIAKTVSVTFSGTPNTNIIGTLLIPGDKGIAVGIEDAQGLVVNLGVENIYTLVEGSTALGFKAYIIGEPTALQNKTIVRGDFSATATFTLNYP